MEMTYEVQIRCVSPSAEFYVDHRLPTFPDTETLVGLKGEAERMFEAMFDQVVEEMYVSLSLTEQEWPEAEEVEARDE